MASQDSEANKVPGIKDLSDLLRQALQLTQAACSEDEEGHEISELDGQLRSLLHVVDGAVAKATHWTPQHRTAATDLIDKTKTLVGSAREQLVGGALEDEYHLEDIAHGWEVLAKELEGAEEDVAGIVEGRIKICTRYCFPHIDVRCQ